MDWSIERQLLLAAKIKLEMVLSTVELEHSEHLCGTRFPEDLRSLLSVNLPISDGFPD